MQLEPTRTICPNCQDVFEFIPANRYEVDLANAMGAHCAACCRQAYSQPVQDDSDLPEA